MIMVPYVTLIGFKPCDDLKMPQALREDRTQSPKMAEIKLQAYFLHASPSYLTSIRYGNGSLATGSTYSTSSEIYTTQLFDPISLTNFYVVRQTTNKKNTNTDFTLKVNTTLLGEITVPRFRGEITLAGRESKILVSNYNFGSSKLAYSTAEVSNDLIIPVHLTSRRF